MFVNVDAIVVFGAGSVIFVIVIIFVIVAVFVNVVAVFVFGAGRPPNGLLSSYHPPNGENERAGV